jgi:hypothetical protein
VKSIKNITKNQNFEIKPSEIIFKNVKLNFSYVVSGTIRNFLKKTMRVKVFQPKKYPNVFKCHYKWQKGKAVGMGQKFKVTFNAPELKDYKDSFDIVFESGESITIPIYAFKPTSIL